MNIAGKIQLIEELTNMGVLTREQIIQLFNDIEGYYGPSLFYEEQNYYLINNKYLEENEYKNLVFNKDMENLLK